MKTLFIDTETTSKAFFNLHSSHPSQPRMVSLAAILADGAREMCVLDLVIRPEGFEIPAEASAIHGITTEAALRDGVPVRTAIHLLIQLANEADQFAAHNAQFDRLIVEREFSGFFNTGKPFFCTMEAMTPICNLPGQYGHGPKWPKLSEAYRHCFGRELEGAHGALADVRACKEIYEWLQAGRVKAGNA